MRVIELGRAAWGAALVAAPRFVLTAVPGATLDRRSVLVTRLLGARHVTQAALSGVAPSPEVLAAGVWTDGVHALTAIGLAAADPARARGALVDAAVAGGWAAFGLRALTTGRIPPPDHDRRRDAAARAVLRRMPGGRGLLARAAAERVRHAPPVGPGASGSQGSSR